jgi:hypothetical protein
MSNTTRTERNSPDVVKDQPMTWEQIAQEINRLPENIRKGPAKFAPHNNENQTVKINRIHTTETADGDVVRLIGDSRVERVEA